jgi:D-alanyl-D-alanine carboxypeptidase
MRLLAVVLGAGLWIGAASASVARLDFAAQVMPVRWADVRFSYRAGCPVGPAELRTVRLSYWGFDGRPHRGRLVVNRRVTHDVAAVFRRLYAVRFPIRKMVPVSNYRGSDDASMAADNTSGFNCRFVAGTRRWSMHAYGLAVDVNPVENPYVAGGRISPRAGRRYVDRARRRPGMAVPRGVLVEAFAAAGWEWGGHWIGTTDYQHFSTTGD